MKEPATRDPLRRGPFLVAALTAPAIAAAWAWLAVATAPAAALEGPELEGALLTLEIQQEMDRRVLMADRQEYLELLATRRETASALNEAYGELDALYQRLVEGDLTPVEAQEMQADMAEIEERIHQWETEGDRIRREAWLLRDRMREKGLRLAMLADRIQDLRSATSEVRGPLTGRWRVTVLPHDLVGEFLLRQSGTLVSGRYRLGTGRTGSFTGTVIGNRVTLQQIDSEFGRDSVYYGDIQPDGQSIEGTWESLSLGTGRPSFGIWRASKIPEEEEGSPGASAPGDEDQGLPETMPPTPAPGP